MGSGDELRQADLETDPEFAEWEFGYTINGHPRARRPRTSPPVWLWGEDWTDLRDQIRAWISRHR